MPILVDDARTRERTALSCLPDRFPPGARAVAALQPDQCRWPLGEVSEETFGFCGMRRTRGAYCALHAPLSRKGRR